MMLPGKVCSIQLPVSAAEATVIPRHSAPATVRATAKFRITPRRLWAIGRPITRCQDRLTTTPDEVGCTATGALGDFQSRAFGRRAATSELTSFCRTPCTAHLRIATNRRQGAKPELSFA